MALQWGYLGCASFEVRTAPLDVPWAGAASTSPSFVGKAGRSVLQGNPGPGPDGGVQKSECPEMGVMWV